jgi:hypothetical protein
MPATRLACRPEGRTSDTLPMAGAGVATTACTLVGGGGVDVGLTDCVPPCPPSPPPLVLVAGGGVVETEFGDVVCEEILKSQCPSLDHKQSAF